MLINEKFAIPPPDIISPLRRALTSLLNLRELILLLMPNEMEVLFRTPKYSDSFELTKFTTFLHYSAGFFMFLCAQSSITNISFMGQWDNNHTIRFRELSADSNFLPNLKRISGIHIFLTLLVPGRPVQHVDVVQDNDNPPAAYLLSSLSQSSRPLLSLSLRDNTYLDCPTGWEVLEGLRHTTIAHSLQELSMFDNRLVRILLLSLCIIS